MNYCTYFDYNYLSRFLSLKYSLDRFSLKNKYYILALDEKVSKFFKQNNFKNIEVITLEQLENFFPELIKIKNSRSIIEYYFTLSPFLPLYLNIEKKLSFFSYLDADLFFYKDPNTFYELHKFDISIILIKQNSKPKYGYYNVGWITYNFYHAETSRILKKWSIQCLDWCYDIPVKNKYADQKYLDYWVHDLKKIKILNPSHTCLSPWDDNELIENNLNNFYAFHFHAFGIIEKNFFTTGFHKYRKKVSKKILMEIYFPYLSVLLGINKKYNLKIKTSRYQGSLRNFYFYIKFLIFQLSRISRFIYSDTHKIKKIKNYT